MEERSFFFFCPSISKVLFAFNSSICLSKYNDDDDDDDNNHNNIKKVKKEHTDDVLGKVRGEKVATS